MIEEAAEPRGARGGVLSVLEKEDLDDYAVEELADRIERLEAEIARARTKMASKQTGKSAADALFKF